MSLKQREQIEHYHISSEDDFKSIELVEDSEDELCQKLDEAVVDDANQIICALENIISELKDVPTALIQQVVDEMLTKEDKREMIDLYYKCFDNLPNDNELKLYVLHLFNQLCMPITRMPENKIL
jgi:hypothetical protein